MTTIATDGKSMACDSQMTTGNFVEPIKAKKIKKEYSMEFGENIIIGFAGPVYLMDDVFECVLSGNKFNKECILDDDNFSLLVLTESGKVYEMTKTGKYIEVGYPNSIGSGSAFAVGAMANGATPEEAIEAAVKFDCYSGGEIQTLFF